MTSTAIHSLPAMGFHSTNSAAAARPGSVLVASILRQKGVVKAVIMLSWLVGITASFLTVGVIGMFADDLPPIHLKTLEDLEADKELPMVETSMAELMSMEASAETTAEAEPVLPTEVMETPEVPMENLDLPEIAEAMTMEDIFAVPTAPKIEQALTPVDPVVKPKPAPTPKPRTAAAPGGGGTQSSTPQAGVAGGRGAAGSSGKGTFPAPPYPSFARSGGMQGTVRLSISVGPSGAVESVTVISSTGYSALDEHAAAWVRRNWRWSGGAASRYTLPLTFRLR